MTWTRTSEQYVVSMKTSATRKWAFRSVMKPTSVGASLSEPLSMMQQRLLVAEGQGAELAKKLGVSGDESGVGFIERSRPEALVARVCRLESLLHTLRLSVFRIETARELASSNKAHLQEQLAALQEQCEEDQQSSQKEVMRLRSRLQQEIEEAQKETQMLREQLHASNCSQMDVAVAADELKKVKAQLNQKLHQMKEEMVQEKATRLEAEQFRDALLQRVKEVEAEVEREKEQVNLLQGECHGMKAERQDVRAELEEKEALAQSLQEDFQLLKQQLEEKYILASDLSTELKSVRLTLQKQQQENRTLLRGTEEVRAATDKVQALNDQLEAQCSDLSSTLRSLTEEKAQLRASLKLEQERSVRQLKDTELRFETTMRNMQREVREAKAHRRLLTKELETLRADHTKLQQSSAAALDAAVSHQELLERTIRRLRGELCKVVKEGEAMKKKREEDCAELEGVKTSYKSLQDQLKEVREELQLKESQLCVLRSETEYIQQENLRLKDQLQNTHMKNTGTLHTELEDKLDELHTLGRQRESALHKAQQEINQLIKQVDELRKAKHHGSKVVQLEVCEAQSLEQLRTDVTSLQAELLDHSSSQQEELQSERRLTHRLRFKCQMLEKCVAKLKEQRDEAERKMKEVSFESQQIFENLQEAHSWFRSRFDSLKGGLEHSRTGDLRGATKESMNTEVVCMAEPEPERWASTLQRWETKKELEHIANGARAAARTHSLT